MVDALESSGAVTDPGVLEAMGRVPREGFVPGFWSMTPSTEARGSFDIREWRVDRSAADYESVLTLVYDVNRALGIRRAAH
jgi:hypothetical protein